MVSGQGTAQTIRWQAESVRLTAFAREIPVEANWETVAGEPPDLRTEQPKARQVEESGAFEDGQLTLVKQAARADWQFGKLRDIPGAPPLRELPETLQQFRIVPDRWLARVPSINRLALGAILLFPVGTRAEGYLALHPYFRTLRPDPDASEDLLYQVNRPTTSSVLPSLKLNRIMKWSVNQRRSVQIVISAQGPSAVERNTFDCRLELDLSTDAAQTNALPETVLRPLWDELASVAIAVAERGEFV